MQADQFYLIVDPSGEVRLLRHDPEKDKLDHLRSAVNYEYFEHVPTRYKIDGVELHLLVDEEGALKRYPEINPFATIAYGSDIFGQAIVCTVGEDEDGEFDIMPLKASVVPSALALCKLYS